MPDKNKLAQMRAKGFKLVKSCMTCIHSRWAQPRCPGMYPWGMCSANDYHHRKHGVARQLPAHMVFVCEDHEWIDIDDGSENLELGRYGRLVSRMADEG